MKKISTIIIIAVIVVTIVAISIVVALSPEVLPDYMVSLGQGRVLTPNRGADVYYTDHIAVSCWQFNLSTDEIKSVSNYIKQYNDSWYELTDYSLDYISSVLFPRVDTIDLNSISVNGSFYCIIDYTHSFTKIGEFHGSQIGIYIWDSSNSKYYCLFDSGR